MLHHRRRSGFTLVELLVVIAIITMLAGLLLPAVQQAREAGRRATCTNNQRQVAIAFTNFEGAKGYLPGSFHFQSLRPPKAPTAAVPNPPVEVARNSSFVFGLLPFLDRNDLFVEYGTGGPRYTESLTAHLKVMTCPNDSTAVNNASEISYVVNAGRQDYIMTDHVHNGHGSTLHRSGNANMANGAVVRHTHPTSTKTSLSYINGGDGTSTTILLTENIDAAHYNDGNESYTAVTWDVGAYQASIDGTAPVPGYALNSRVGERNGTTRFPRPSSYHGGGALITFADSHVQFIDENVSYSVYCQLMTSRSRSVTDEGNAILTPPMPSLSENTY